jgi:hypothetical protein
MDRFVFPLALLAAISTGASLSTSAAEPLAEKYLLEGQLADGEAALTARLASQPADEQARFGLGAIQFLRAIEGLGQSLYEFGALGPESRLGAQIPLVRLTVPKNPAPKEVRYSDVRGMFERLLKDLAKVEATLGAIKDRDVKLPLHFGLIRLDLDGDGRAADEETLWRIYAGLNRGLRLNEQVLPADAEAFLIGFDYADVQWLRGYCRLLSSLCEVALAYDQQPLFDVVARHLFDKPVAPALPPALLKEQDRPFEDQIADAILAIHVAHFEVKEPERMKSALEHLRQVVRLSRQSWQAIGAETDDDHEWIPGKGQTGVIPGVRITAEMIDGWHKFLSEADELLAGKKLVPHWRLNAEHGINLRRVFEEPREFDVVRWAHGAAAVPYTERGPVTSREVWGQLQQTFRGQFIGFALWFN